MTTAPHGSRAGVRIDLHTHSSASDGTDSPAQLVRAASAAGLDVVALTDHDTTAGWAEAADALPEGLLLVPGAEFSCRFFPDPAADAGPGPRGEDGAATYHDPAGAIRPGGRRSTALHLLGYLFDPAEAALAAEAARLRSSRLDRGRTMVDAMVRAGLPISWAQVSALAGDGTVGRPHLARALVDSGVVASVDEAFAGPVSARAPYYQRKADADVFAMIALIRAAGGLPVFAHPIATRRGPTVDDDVVAAMAAAGLVGLEVDHPDHGPQDRARAARLARELDLIPTGSSDYHGTNKTRNPLGAGRTDPESLARLLALPTAIDPIGPG